jgi:hypothetical protein
VELECRREREMGRGKREEKRGLERPERGD